MAGYSRTWDCYVCGERQETMDYSDPPVCDKCLEPLARRLCHQALKPVKRSDGVDIFDHPAVNRDHFMREAGEWAKLLLRRRKR